jgi:hypothetical protein
MPNQLDYNYQQAEVDSRKNPLDELELLEYGLKFCHRVSLSLKDKYGPSIHTLQPQIRILPISHPGINRLGAHLQFLRLGVAPLF